MRIRHLRPLTFPALLLLAACSKSVHPLAGNWAEQTPDGKKGIQLVFSEDGAKLFPHGRPSADNLHSHPKATFTFDPATKVLTIQSDLTDDGKTLSWTGTVDGDALQLRGGETTLKFAKGGSAH
jgi:hypothetical protein